MANQQGNSPQQETPSRETIDRMLESGFAGQTPADSGQPDAFAVDVVERDDCFVVRAALPGATPDDLHVTVQGDQLTIRGKVHDATERDGDRWILREHRRGEFERSVHLPARVDAAAAEARFEHGMLTLTLPRSDTAAADRGAVAPPAAAKETSGLVNPTAVDPTKPKVAGSQPPTSTAGMGPDEDNRDMVSDESEASFPASDPPSWTSERT